MLDDQLLLFLILVFSIITFIFISPTCNWDLAYLVTPGTLLYSPHPSLSMEFRASTALSKMRCVSLSGSWSALYIAKPWYLNRSSSLPLGMGSTDVTWLSCVSAGLCLSLDARFLDHLYGDNITYALHAPSPVAYSILSHTQYGNVVKSLGLRPDCQGSTPDSIAY